MVGVLVGRLHRQPADPARQRAVPRADRPPDAVRARAVRRDAHDGEELGHGRIRSTRNHALDPGGGCARLRRYQRDQPDGGPVQLLNDQIVLITGATDGLGRALARAADEAGATVLVHGRSEERIADTLGELSDRARAYRADLASLAEVDAAGRRGARGRGRLDVLVNNAGIGNRVPGGGVRQESADGYRAAVRGQLPRRLRAHAPAARPAAARLRRPRGSSTSPRPGRRRSTSTT